MAELLFGISLFLSVSVTVHAQETRKLVVLHNNDTHSRIEPLPAGTPHYAGLGGVVRQHAYVKVVRNENRDVLLFHAGDFVQGTPYFNEFGGQAEVACMNRMGYDAACLGNHEFDNGLDRLAEMVRAADFPIVATNLDFTGTPMEGLTKPYAIVERSGLRIGIIGLTVSPDGLVARYNYGAMRYLDPVPVANETAEWLKNRKNCDLVICLSHLGYNANEVDFGDVSLARASENIDVILGGHTHTFLRFADRRVNRKGEEVVINQVGDRGIFMGRLDIVLERKGKE
jgi:5'-nucleotidase